MKNSTISRPSVRIGKGLLLLMSIWWEIEHCIIYSRCAYSVRNLFSICDCSTFYGKRKGGGGLEYCTHNQQRRFEFPLFESPKRKLIQRISHRPQPNRNGWVEFIDKFRKNFRGFESMWTIVCGHVGHLVWANITLLFQSPIALLLKIVIPIVDTNLEINGWSKLLNTLQIIILPMFLAFITQGT